MSENMKTALIGAAFGLIPALLAVAIAAGVLSNKVQSLETTVQELSRQLNRSSIESGIWAVLTQNTSDIVALQTQMDRFTEISKPDEIRYWGFVKKQVPKNESKIEELNSEIVVLKTLVDGLKEKRDRD